MQVKPTVSILMTAYNRENLISEAIESVLAQTYTDFELIVVDDCSKDNTYEVAKAYERKDNRIKVFANDKNLGDYPNRSRAAQHAVGEFIKYFDSDDVMYPHCIDVMVRGMRKFPEAALGMIWGDAVNEPSPKLFTPHDAFYSYYFNNRWMQVGPSGAIYKADRFREVNGFGMLPYVGDFDLNLKLGAKWPVVRLQTDLFYYRVHPEQENSYGQTITGDEKLKYIIQKRHLGSPDCPLSEAEITVSKKMIDKLQSRRAVKWFLRTRKFKTLKILVEESGLGWNGFWKGIFTI